MTTKKREHYLKNEDLLAELKILERTGKRTDKLHVMFYQLATRIGSKASFRGYTYIDDMISYAYERCITKADRFDTSRDNPFSYFTTVVTNTFLRFIEKEKNYQKKKWSELASLETEMCHQYGINFSLNDNIREKMYE